MAATDFSLATLMLGGKVVIHDGFEVDSMCAVLESEPISWLVAMPGMIEPLIDGLKRNRPRISGVRMVGAMADLVPLHQIAELTGLIGAPYLNSFGATETGLAPASGALLAPGVVPQSLAKRESGFCLIRLVDTDDRDVPVGMPGELAIRGPTLFSGYWNAPEANALDFRGGWFHMGDLFVRHADGTLDFVDRAKYLIKSGGENIYPAEIERVLLSTRLWPTPPWSDEVTRTGVKCRWPSSHSSPVPPSTRRRCYSAAVRNWPATRFPRKFGLSRLARFRAAAPARSSAMRSSAIG